MRLTIMRAASYLIDVLQTIDPAQLNAREQNAYFDMLGRLNNVLEDFLRDSYGTRR